MRGMGFFLIFSYVVIFALFLTCAWAVVWGFWEAGRPVREAKRIIKRARWRVL